MVGGGAANGFITGAAMGGLQSIADGTSFWKGTLSGGLMGGATAAAAGALQRLTLRPSATTIDDVDLSNSYDQFTSNSELDGYINNNIGDINIIEDRLRVAISLANKNNLPSKDYSLKNGFIMKGNSVKGGLTAGFKGGWFTQLKSQVYISPAAKGLSYKKSVIGHELIHSYHNSIGLKNSWYSENAAYEYSYIYSGKITSVPSAYRQFVYPAKYDWRPLSTFLRMF